MNMKKQSKKMVGKCLSIFTALLLVLSFMPGTAAVYAQSSGTTLAVAEYTSASGEVAEGSTATNATITERGKPACRWEKSCQPLKVI